MPPRLSPAVAAFRAANLATPATTTPEEGRAHDTAPSADKAPRAHRSPWKRPNRANAADPIEWDRITHERGASRWGAGAGKRAARNTARRTARTAAREAARDENRAAGSFPDCVNYTCGCDETLAPHYVRGLCLAHRNAMYHIDNREKLNAATRAHTATHREQKHAAEIARKLANPALFKAQNAISHAKRRTAAGPACSPADLEIGLLLYAGRCSYCHASLTGGGLTWDHVLPVSRGGTNAADNLVPACLPCNSHKSAKTPAEWLGDNFFPPAYA